MYEVISNIFNVTCENNHLRCCIFFYSHVTFKETAVVSRTPGTDGNKETNISSYLKSLIWINQLVWQDAATHT